MVLDLNYMPHNFIILNLKKKLRNQLLPAWKWSVFSDYFKTATK